MSENDKTQSLSEQEKAELRLFCTTMNLPYPDENLAPEISRYIREFRNKMQNDYMEQATDIGNELYQRICRENYSLSHKKIKNILTNSFSESFAKQTKETGLTFDDSYISELVTKILDVIQELEQPHIEQLKSVLPKKHVMPNNKLANVMTMGIIDIGEITLEESKKGAKKRIETTCVLTYEGDKVKLTGRQSFTEYDRNVYNAVASLYVYGDPSHIVTPAMVYRTMTGLTDAEKPTAGQLAAVARSLDKMRFIRARIDCTEELKMRHITLNSQQINNGEIDTSLLMAEAVKVKAGGQTVKAYHILKVPILYEYAAAVKQVLTVSASTLDIKELNPDGSVGARLPNTESRILIKGYLIRRIEGMKGKNKLNNPVIALYDYQRDGETHYGLYSITGKVDPTREEMRRIREDAEKMLAYWKATGYITDYEVQTQGKKITGFKITAYS